MNSISDIQDKLKEKQMSVREITTEYLSNIEKTDPILNAFLCITKDSALRKADLLDQEISKSDDLETLFKERPLFGIPVAHKDIYSTKDVETTASSNILKGYIPPYDATSVVRIENAGAVTLGKLNNDAFAHGASGENSDFGETKNPYDLDRVPGGSSSGSVVSVSAEMTVVSTATDTGGSIRNPSAFTNTVGIKPTYGRVSRYGIIAMASSLDTIGHVTNTIMDNAKVLNVTAGYDPKDATSSKIAPDDFTKELKIGVKNLKIGVPKEYMSSGLDPEVNTAISNSIKEYQKLGAEIIDIELPSTDLALAVYYILVPSEVSSNLARFDGIRYGHDRSTFGDEAKRRIMIGTYTLSAGYYDAYYLKAQKVRTIIINEFKKAFEKADIILGPAMPMLSPLIGENTKDPLKMYLMDILTCPINIAGLPALSVPAGFSKNGLPIGLQLIGNYFSEKLLYRTGYALEEVFKYYKRRPTL